MDEPLRRQRDMSVAGLESLIRRGRQIHSARAADAVRAWQRDCAAAIHQLSGGSKAHWLSRAFSNALLVRGIDGAVVVEANAMEIVERILDVLAQGAASLSRMEEAAGKPGAAPPLRQFDFVHNAELRPVLEQAFTDSRAALERGEWALSLILSCSVIEALLTDALEYAYGLPFDSGESRVAQGRRLTAHGLPPETHEPRESSMTDWSFAMRIAEAERRGLIRGSCTRLPPVARKYRELADADGELRADASVSARDARVGGQVLRVVMRDLNPGR